MKMQFIEEDSQHESESDYETAIEMSHWNSYRFTCTFKTEKGLLVTFSGSEEKTTYDSHDENEDDDGPMYKSSRSSSGSPKINNNYNLLAFIQNKIKAVDVQNFKEKIISKYGIDEYEDIYQNQYSPIHHNLIDYAISIGDEELNILKKYIETKKFNNLDFYDLPLTEETCKEIIDFEIENNTIFEENNITIVSNFENKEMAKNIISEDSLKDKKIINKKLFDLIINYDDSPEIANKIVTLMKEGANFSLENDIGDNAFMVACRKNMKNITAAIVDEIFEYSSDFVLYNFYFDINKANNEGDTALIFTAKHGNRELLSKILNNNENVDIYHINKFGKDAVKTAQEFNNDFILEAIIKHVKDYADNYESKQVDKISSKKM